MRDPHVCHVDNKAKLKSLIGMAVKVLIHDRIVKYVALTREVTKSV